ncbi:hypothetical protein [Methanosarcina vacuolata]|uniref:hypothetical protein n=1 Tax=Methanosarcina vacuolata TaxID=2215 RepID=UPI00064FCDB7|nr:hypothetical protein [Methanosarcina vacuolata]
MYDINDPFSIRGVSKTESKLSNSSVIDLEKESTKSKNDYRAFFEKETFEKYIETYPKAEVRKRVLCRVQIPD